MQSVSRFRRAVDALVLSGLLLAAVCLATPTTLAASGPMLDVDARTACQARIEDLRWQEMNAEAVSRHASRESALPAERLRERVEDQLRQEALLETRYGLVIDAVQLQRELDRMARTTLMPERLAARFDALGHDADLIAECLARPRLVAQRLRHAYVNDAALHADLRAEVGRAMAAQSDGPAGHHETTRALVRQSAAKAADAADRSATQTLSDAQFDAERQRLLGVSRPEGIAPASMPAQPTLRETERAFVHEAVLSHSDDRIDIRVRSWPKQSFEHWWRRQAEAIAGAPRAAVSGLRLPRIQPRNDAKSEPSEQWILDAVPEARNGHHAHWTGTEMIIWGGTRNSLLHTASRYDPATDSWTPVSTLNAPPASDGATTVWTGVEMIVWGGYLGSYRNTGNRYNPATDSWQVMTVSGAPAPRMNHSAIWTGSEMIVWGGGLGSSRLTSGGRYDPATDAWSALSEVGAPSGRMHHRAVWTGNEMIVWGGYNNDALVNGGRYDPANDRWQPMATAGAPVGMANGSVLWAGDALLIWGVEGASPASGNGFRYRPANDSWSAISDPGFTVPQTAQAVWTGKEMLLWGQTSWASGEAQTGGARYRPADDTWAPIHDAAGLAPRSLHSAVWTGSEMIVWGGRNSTGSFVSLLRDGARYHLASDSWTPTRGADGPSARFDHTAVWTGSEMIVWGGANHDGPLDSGGRYDPATASWQPTTLDGAPRARSGHRAIWTGGEMILWGGQRPWPDTSSTPGARYDPLADAWTLTSIPEPGVGQNYHSLVWTGEEMIVWGGHALDSNPATTGARYRPATDAWTNTAMAGAPAGQTDHVAAWTGDEMLVWGGWQSSAGARYRPQTDQWLPISTHQAPSPRGLALAAWTGEEMIVWGGRDDALLRSGARYRPTTDTWQPTDADDAPLLHEFSTAVWTGREMVAWGTGSYDIDESGRRYDPATDQWTPLTGRNAPARRSGHSAVWTGQQMIVWGGRAIGPMDSLGAWSKGPTPYPTEVNILPTAPSLVGEPVQALVDVVSPGVPVEDGRVEVLASSGESCLAPGAESVTPDRTRFACTLAFASAGARELVAVYSQSASHAPGHSPSRRHDVNGPLRVIAPGPQSMWEDGFLGPLPITLVDEESSGESSLAASTDNPDLFDSAGLQWAGSGAARTLHLTPRADAHGEALVTLTASNPLGTVAIAQFPVTVVSVNDPPVITLAGTGVLQHPVGTSGPFYYPGLASASAGPPDEAAWQAVLMALTTDHATPGLFQEAPVLHLNGMLYYFLFGSEPGAARLRVTATDSGGQWHGGQDQSSRTFWVLVGTGTRLQVEAIRQPALTQITPQGTVLSYLIRLRNLGPDAVSNAQLAMPRLEGLSAVVWTCGAPGTGCTPSSGSGMVSTQITLAAGEQAQVMLSGLADPAADYLEMTIEGHAPSGVILLRDGGERVHLTDPISPRAVFRNSFE